MNSNSQSVECVLKATRQFRGYLLAALEAKSRVMSVEDVLLIAEVVWNNYEPDVGPPHVLGSTACPEPTLIRELALACYHRRESRHASERFFVFALEYERTGQALRLNCDLMWSDSVEIHAIEICLPGPT